MYAEFIRLVNGTYFENAFCPGFDYTDEVFRAQVDDVEYLIPMSSVAYIKVDKEKTMKHQDKRVKELSSFWEGIGKHEIHD